MSNVPLLWNRLARDFFLEWSRAGWWRKIGLLARVRPKMFKPVPALELGLTDPICGLNMGQTAEVLAKEFGITRAEQDQFALLSHERATAAWKRGFFTDEVVPVPTQVTGGAAVSMDVGPGESVARSAGQVEADLRSGEWDRYRRQQLPDHRWGGRHGAHSRRQLTGREPLGYVRAYALAGRDPRRMGLGPVFAIHKLLQQTGLRMADFELIEINEAFAAQVLACRKAMASSDFAHRELNSDQTVGEFDLDRLNVNGGAIALGHPVGTSGTRLIITLLRALRERGLKRGLAALCVGGGQGAAAWVETVLD